MKKFVSMILVLCVMFSLCAVGVVAEDNKVTTITITNDGNENILLNDGKEYKYSLSEEGEHESSDGAWKVITEGPKGYPSNGATLVLNRGSFRISGYVNQILVDQDAVLTDLDAGGYEEGMAFLLNGGTINGGNYESDSVYNFGGVIENATFDGDVYNYGGQIKSGTFNGDVMNYPEANLETGDIYFDKPGVISGGTFNSLVMNCSRIEGNTVLESESTLVNLCGQILGGTFKGTVMNSMTELVDDTTLPKGAPQATIEDGVFMGPVLNAAYLDETDSGMLLTRGLIKNGTFNGAVENSADIVGGTFNGAVHNFVEVPDDLLGGYEMSDLTGKISGGTFAETVTNEGSITGGSFDKEIDNREGGTVNLPKPNPEPVPQPVTPAPAEPVWDVEVEEEEEEIELLKGSKQKYTQGSEEGLSFRFDAKVKHFRRLKIDGKTIDKASYEVSEGSTIITLTPEYMDTLKAGKHTLKAIFKDGSAEVKFTVLEGAKIEAPVVEADKQNPSTGAAEFVGAAAALAVVSIAGAVALSKKH